jgi:RNA polymerase-associated protein
MDFQIIDVDLDHKPEDLAVMNPVQPGAGARRARPRAARVEHHQRVHRRAFPASAADAGRSGDARAGALFLHRFEKELFCHIDALEGNNQKQIEKARNHVRDSLLQIAPVFAKHKHMLGEEYSMLDVAITPLLWRSTTTASRCPSRPRR